MYYVYILACFKDDSDEDVCLYTGQTNNLKLRLEEHRESIENGETDRFMGRFDNFELIWYREVETREDAIHLEYYIKGLSRPEKEKYMQKYGVMADDDLEV